MKLILLVLALPLLNNTCNKKAVVPPCISEKIEKIKKEPKWNPPAEVNEYVYKDKQVFLFSSSCCDKYNELYDKDCNYVCAPSGGYTGKGDNLCSDFQQTAKHVRLVWKDER